MNKITAELIQGAERFTNALDERQLDLRAKRIGVIENLGATLDFFDCIDLSDNQIKKLNNFSFLPRLRSLILTNNLITVIHLSPEMVPNLENLCLLNNKLAELEEIKGLGSLPHLARLILVNNPVTYTANYRLYTIRAIPTLRVLDFDKVTESERRQARGESL
jgi:U2 small nuclear ribonucleoprotein A'